MHILSVPCDCELFLISFLTGIEKSIFAKSIDSYHVPGAVLICSSKDTTFSTMAVVCNYYSGEFVVVYKLFFRDQTDKWRPNNDHHSRMPQILEWGNNLVHDFLMHYYFVIIILARGQSQRHPFGNSTVRPFTWLTKKPMCGWVTPTPSLSNPVIHSWTEKMTTGWAHTRLNPEGPL